MKVNLFVPAPFFIVLVACKDDSLPKFPVTSWIKKGELYKVKYFADSLNTSDTVLTITDFKGNEIHPNKDIFGFRSDRFDFINIGLN